MNKKIKEKNGRQAILPRVIFIIGFLALWEVICKLQLFPPILFPSLEAVMSALFKGFLTEALWSKVLYSMTLIVKGMLYGLLLALLFSVLAIISKTCYSIYSMIVATLDLIPGVALVPLAILWFGVGEETIIFIVLHSIVWPVSRNILDGFTSIPGIFIEFGKNIGLRGIRLVLSVYIPAAFSYLLSGLRVGWARAWRAVISTEMIFGTTSAGSGIGWYIYMKRTSLDTAGVFASLIVIVLVGLVVEYGLFGTIEKHTVLKWGIAK